jgi:hypothetical protein
VGGLPWLNPAEFRGVKPEGPKKKKKTKIIIFYFLFLVFCWHVPARRRRPRGAPRSRLRKIKIKIKNYFFLAVCAEQAASRGPVQGHLGRKFLFFYFFSQPTPRSAAGPPAPSRDKPTKNQKINIK